jgi:hypothetical protein
MTMLIQLCCHSDIISSMQKISGHELTKQLYGLHDVNSLKHSIIYLFVFLLAILYYDLNKMQECQECKLSYPAL